jgi:hypothetical protein
MKVERCFVQHWEVPTSRLGVSRDTIPFGRKEPLVEISAAHTDPAHLNGALSSGVWDFLIDRKNENVHRAAADALRTCLSLLPPLTPLLGFLDLAEAELLVSVNPAMLRSKDFDDPEKLPTLGRPDRQSFGP